MIHYRIMTHKTMKPLIPIIPQLLRNAEQYIRVIPKVSDFCSSNEVKLWSNVVCDTGKGQASAAMVFIFCKPHSPSHIQPSPSRLHSALRLTFKLYPPSHTVTLTFQICPYLRTSLTSRSNFNLTW